jgi:hypothetical protein
MTTKLNLTIKESTAKKIKAYAAQQGTSVSKIATDYFDKLTAPKKKKRSGKSFVEKYSGILSGKIPINIEKAKDEYLKEKYGV